MLEELYNTKRVKSGFKSEQKKFFIVKNPAQKDQVIGSAFCSIYNEVLSIEALAVHSKFRRQGIACSLLNYLENFLKEHSLKKIEFSVLSNNKPMVNCALKSGYSIVDQRDNVYDINDNPCSNLFFEKKF